MRLYTNKASAGMQVLKFKGLPSAVAETPAGASGMDRPAARRRFSPALAGLVALVVLSAGAGLFAYVKFGLVRTVSVRADRLEISQVRTGLFRDYVPTTGTIAPRETIFLDAVEGGQVIEVLVEEGAMVAAGQPLVRLDNRRLELEVVGREVQFTEQQNNLVTLQLAFTQNALQHRRAVEDADYQVERVSAEIDRMRPLIERGFAATAKIKDLERELNYQKGVRATRIEAQEADRQSMEKQLADLRVATARQTKSLTLIREGLENLTVTSPIAGQLTLLSAKPGQSIGQGQRVGQVAVVDSFKVTAQIDEFYLGRIVAGQPAFAVIRGAEQAMTVTKVYPDVRERSFQVDLAFEGKAPEGLRPGQTAQLRIELGEQPNSLIVDNGAFFEDAGGKWVFVLSLDGATAERRDVRLGRRNPEAIEVLSGLRAGDRVVTSSYQPYRDIERISITGAAAPKRTAKP